MEKLTRILAVLDRPEECEIVLNKAVALARCFTADVELLLGESVQASDFSKLIHTLGYDHATLTSLHRDGESICGFIQKGLLRSDPDLIIKAPAGAHPLCRWSLDANDWRLANECQTPVLLARHRPWSKPLRFAAAVDMADDEATHLARGILHTAGYLAMGCKGNLDILYSEREQEDPALRIERTVKLARLVREFHVGCEHIQVLSGAPEKTLPPLATTRGYDVLVLGAQTRRQGFSGVLGGLTSRMLEATEGDVLLVKSPERGDLRVRDRAHRSVPSGMAMLLRGARG